ncbi:MAG: MaoC family dehydratase [Syntrophorhabdales bacterium]|jgi:acyl dehydratase
MTRSTFRTSVEDRYFEDYEPGAVHEFGDIAVEEEEMISFARRYDPQAFHTDPHAAAKTVFGGLIASGWLTAALAMRLIVDHYISHVASLGSPGIDEVRWLKPVRPGDRLSVRISILQARRSRTKPDRGTVRALVEVTNQNREVVMSWKGISIIGCRDALPSV